MQCPRCGTAMFRTNAGQLCHETSRDCPLHLVSMPDAAWTWIAALVRAADPARVEAELTAVPTKPFREGWRV